MRLKVGELLRAIDGYDGQPTTAAALKLAPYVFVRPTELRAAEWPEFSLDSEQPECETDRCTSRAVSRGTTVGLT